jgi:uncharacterized protein (TIGR03382 family)
VGDRSAAQAVTVQNLGTASVTLTGAALTGPAAADFTTDFAATTLAPGGQAAFGVTFKPGAAGERTATLTFTGDDGTHDLALGGTGTSPAATLSPAEVLLPGARAGGGAGSSQVSLTNDGTAPLSIAGYQVTGANAADFTLDPPQLAFALAPGATTTWVVTFRPAAAGARVAAVTVQTDAGDRSAALSGTAFTSVGRLTTDTLSFGPGVLGVTSAAQSVDLFNDGTRPLVFLGGAVSGPGASSFAAALPAGPKTLAAGASVRAAVTFTPAAASAQSATLTVHTDAGDRTVALSGQGTLRTLALSSETLEFAALAPGTRSDAQTVTVRNNGATPAQVTSWALSGPQAGDFAVTPASQAKTLAPGATLDVAVVFTPTAPGTRLSLLTFHTEAGALVLPLAGSGAEAAARSSGCSSTEASPAGLLGLALVWLSLARRRRAGRGVEASWPE